MTDIETRKAAAADWFKSLRDQICTAFEAIEQNFIDIEGAEPGRFEFKSWERPGGGGGTIGKMTGRVFEKVGVNISVVHGEFSEQFAKEIPGTSENPQFWAAGTSLVAHMVTPHVPPVHMNTRMIVTQDWWFGGGAVHLDLFRSHGDQDHLRPGGGVPVPLGGQPW